MRPRRPSPGIVPAHRARREALIDPVVLIDLDAAIVELRPSGRPRPDLILRENAQEGLGRLRDEARVVILVDPTARDQLLPHQPDIRAAFARRSLRGVVTRIPMLSCRHKRGEPCDDRKPATGLLQRATDELGVNREGAWLVGDDASVAAGRDLGLRTVRVGPSNVGPMGPTLTADYEARDLLDAANWILLQAALAA